MKLSRILQIIKEEVNGFYNDWSMNDEPSLADKIYQRQGIDTANPNTNAPQEQLSGELAGYLTEAWGTKLNKPVAIYKNPRNLRGYEPFTRGVLLNNGDIYVSQTDKGLHFNIIEFLGKIGAIPQSAVMGDYGKRLPEEYITIVRVGGIDAFAQSPAYDKFPIYYEVMFDLANQKQPFRFKQLPTDAPKVFLDNTPNG
jgi:hypothetical protein